MKLRAISATTHMAPTHRACLDAAILGRVLLRVRDDHTQLRRNAHNTTFAHNTSKGVSKTLLLHHSKTSGGRASDPWTRNREYATAGNDNVPAMASSQLDTLSLCLREDPR